MKISQTAAVIAITILSWTIVAGCEKPAAAKPGPDLSTPKSAAMAFAKAIIAGDVATAKATVVNPDLYGEAIAAMAELAGSTARLRETAIAQFGKDGEGLADAGPIQKMVDDLNSAEVAINGDTATLTTPKKADSAPMKLKNVGGDWRVDVAAMDPNGHMIKSAPMMKNIASAAKDVATEISNGSIKNVAEAKTALMRKMMPMGAPAQRSAPEVIRGGKVTTAPAK